jgi:hypothetical protein
MKWIMSIILLLVCATCYGEENIAEYLQNISVTIKAGGSEGSGVIVTRDVQVSKDGKDKEKINFVWTAGHVVDGLRSVRTVIDSKGQERKTVEFKDAAIVKELVQNGRKVGELKMDARVVKYSDADNGHDLALLMIRKRDFVAASAKFYLEEDPVPIGTQLFHVGSLLGQDGANSMTAGIMSQIGRVLNTGRSSGKIYDQTTATAFPGSSGGGIFLADGPNKGKYVGMLVRGAGEGFNLIVPVRRMKTWCKEMDLMWALDVKDKCPTLDKIKDIVPEDAALEVNINRDNPIPPPVIDIELPTEFPFLIK